MNQTDLVEGDLLETAGLQAFLEVVDTGNFKRAAQKLDRSPAALSMQIKRLEAHLGTILFNRTSRSVTLSSDGEKLLPYARNMIALALEAASKLIAPQNAGTLVLGAPFDIAERHLPNLLKQLATVYPEINVNIVIDESANLLRRFDRGELEIALFNCDPDYDPDFGHVIGTERLVWAGAINGSAHKREPLPLAVFDHGCVWRSQALRSLEGAGRAVRIAYNNRRAMVQGTAVKSDLAVAALPKSYLDDGMSELGREEGLDELPNYQVRMLRLAIPTDPVVYVSEFIQDFWKMRHPEPAAIS
ncbi:LysR family transcriptional regulator (plasmid) [Rhizobium sp. RCAM05350]|nr:LysR family transcriptional regulator [Rhizobium sp. RCAM05350]